MKEKKKKSRGKKDRESTFEFLHGFLVSLQRLRCAIPDLLERELITTYPAERLRGAEASALDDASEARATIVGDERATSADDVVEEALLPVLARQEQACALDAEAITAARIVWIKM